MRQLQDAFFHTLLDNLSDGVYFVDKQRTILYWNKGAERLTGYSAPIVTGKHCQDNILRHVNDDGVQLCLTMCPLAKTLQDGESREANVWLHHKDGFRLPVRVRIAPIFNDDGEVIGAVETFSDNREHVAALEHIARLTQASLTDYLTGLGNRQLVEATLQQRFDEAKRYGWPFGLLFIDIDHFKRVNDTYGHDAGDAVLVSIAKTLTGNARSFDMVGRWGGEEFVLVMPHVNDIFELQRIAHRLRALVEFTDIRTPRGVIQTTISIGATLVRSDDSVETCIGRADQLMYLCKKAGRNCVKVDSTCKMPEDEQSNGVS